MNKLGFQHKKYRFEFNSTENKLSEIREIKLITLKYENGGC